MKIRSFREITLISFRDVTSKAFSWKRSICLWQTFREIRVWSQGLVQKRKATVKKSFCSLTLLFCKHINESTLWSASNNILWPWFSEILEFSEAERFTLISRNILRQNYSSHLNFYSIFTLSKKNAAMPEALLLLCNPALPTARDFRLRKKQRSDIALEKEKTLANQLYVTKVRGSLCNKFYCCFLFWRR